MGNTTSDRSRVAASDPSEVRYFGKKHGLTDDEVKALIKQHGNDRKTLEAAVAGANVSALAEEIASKKLAKVYDIEAAALEAYTPDACAAALK